MSSTSSPRHFMTITHAEDDDHEDLPQQHGYQQDQKEEYNATAASSLSATSTPAQHRQHPQRQHHSPTNNSPSTFTHSPHDDHLLTDLPPSSSSSSLHARLSSLRERYTTSETTLHAYSLKIAEQQNEIQALRDVNTQQYLQMKEAQEHIQWMIELRTKNENGEDENTAAASQQQQYDLTTLRGRALEQSYLTLSSLQTQLTTQSHELSRLRSALSLSEIEKESMLSGTREELERLRRECERMEITQRARNENGRRDEVKMNEYATELQHDLEQAQQRVRELTQELDHANTTLAAHETQLTTVVSALETSEKNYHILSERYEENITQYQELQHEYAEFKEEAEAIRTEHALDYQSGTNNTAASSHSAAAHTNSLSKLKAYYETEMEKLHEAAEQREQIMRTKLNEYEEVIRSLREGRKDTNAEKDTSHHEELFIDDDQEQEQTEDQQHSHHDDDDRDNEHRVDTSTTTTTVDHHEHTTTSSHQQHASASSIALSTTLFTPPPRQPQHQSMNAYTAPPHQQHHQAHLGITPAPNSHTKLSPPASPPRRVNDESSQPSSLLASPARSTISDTHSEETENAYQLQIRQLQHANRMLMQQLSEQTEEYESLLELRKDIEKNQQLEQEMKENIAKLTIRLNELTNELETTHQEKSVMKKEHEMVQSKCQQLQRELNDMVKTSTIKSSPSTTASPTSPSPSSPSRHELLTRIQELQSKLNRQREVAEDEEESNKRETEQQERYDEMKKRYQDARLECEELQLQLDEMKAAANEKTQSPTTPSPSNSSLIQQHEHTIHLLHIKHSEELTRVSRSYETKFNALLDEQKEKYEEKMREVRRKMKEEEEEDDESATTSFDVSSSTLHSLQQQLTLLRQENHHLTLSSQQLTETHRLALEVQRKQLDDTTARLNETMSKLETVKKERREVQARFEDAGNTQKAMAEEIRMMKQQESNDKDKYMQLQQQFQFLSSSSSSSDSMHLSDTLRAQYDSSLSQLRQTYEQSETELKQRLTQLEKQKDDAEEQLEGANRRIRELMNQLEVEKKRDAAVSNINRTEEVNINQQQHTNTSTVNHHSSSSSTTVHNHHHLHSTSPPPASTSSTSHTPPHPHATTLPLTSTTPAPSKALLPLRDVAPGSDKIAAAFDQLFRVMNETNEKMQQQQHQSQQTTPIKKSTNDPMNKGTADADDSKYATPTPLRDDIDTIPVSSHNHPAAMTSTAHSTSHQQYAQFPFFPRGPLISPEHKQISHLVSEDPERFSLRYKDEINVGHEVVEGKMFEAKQQEDKRSMRKRKDDEQRRKEEHALTIPLDSTLKMKERKRGATSSILSGLSTKPKPFSFTPNSIVQPIGNSGSRKRL